MIHLDLGLGDQIEQRPSIPALSWFIHYPVTFHMDIESLTATVIGIRYGGPRTLSSIGPALRGITV